LSAAKEANVEVSPYIAETVRQQSDTKPRKPTTKPPAKGPRPSNNNEGVQEHSAKEATQLSWEQMLLAKFPSFDPAWPDEVKKEWFTAFNRMMMIGKPGMPAHQDNEESEDATEDE
jgi:hypothetical protein